MKGQPFALGMIPFGAVYLIDREMTLTEKRSDLSQMKKMAFNTVVIWPAVSRWDGNPPGQTAFKSIDETLDLCTELGLKVILELQGQNTSAQEAPELFGLTKNRLDLNNPDYLALIRRYIQEVVTHYKGHPALLAYDVFNEVGFYGDDLWTLRAFVVYLREKYADDIQALNRAWGAYFANFEAIGELSLNALMAQYDLWYSVVPKLDWLRFRSWNWALRLAEWTQIIYEVDPDAIVLADALGNDTLHDRTGDYYGAFDRDVARHVDALGLSCWGNMLGERWMEQDVYLWPQFWRSSISAGEGKQVIISEMMTTNRSIFPQEGSSMTDQSRLWSYQAIFHGIKGLIYWQYRPFKRGIQVTGRGLCDLSGVPNEHAEQAADVAAFVQKHAKLLTTSHPDPAGCAILHDPNAQIVMSTLHHGQFYTDAHSGMFQGFWQYGVSPLYVTPQSIASGVPSWVKVLAVPCNVALSKENLSVLYQFVERGGVLLTESRFGILDEEATLHRNSDTPQWTIREKSFTARFTDTIDELAFNNDYFQYLELDAQSRVLVRTATGNAAVTETSIGTGKHIHTAFVISHMIQQERLGAQQLFEKIVKDFPFTPTVRFTRSARMMDVSTLLDDQDQPVLVGITNYEPYTATVTLNINPTQYHIEGNGRIKHTGNSLSVAVAPRQIAAVFL
jgi:beta-galactosidase GanA